MFHDIHDCIAIRMSFSLNSITCSRFIGYDLSSTARLDPAISTPLRQDKIIKRNQIKFTLTEKILKTTKQSSIRLQNSQFNRYQVFSSILFSAPELFYFEYAF